MKRGVTAVFLLVLMLASICLVVAEDPATTTEPEVAENSSITEAVDGAGELANTTIANLSKITGDLKGVGENLGNQTENLLEQEVETPDGLEFLLWPVSGYYGEDQPVTWKTLIISVILLVILFLGLSILFSFTDDAGHKWIGKIIALIAALAIGFFGFVSTIVSALYTIIGNFWYLTGAVIVVVALIFLVIMPLMRKMKHRKNLEAAKTSGEDAGMELARLGASARVQRIGRRIS